MNPFTAELAAERIRDMQADRHTTRVVRRRRAVRSFIARNQLGPSHNVVHH